MENEKQKKILIVGGGFGGVRTALALAHAKIGSRAKIILLSDKPHFEYHAALYRVVTGRSPLEVCIPLRDIFEGTAVEIVIDAVTGVNFKRRVVEGYSGAHYQCDYLVLALGSETAYFDIPGLKELSFGFKSINEALRLKRHIHELFEKMRTASLEEKINATSFIVVGGGASGVELAGELAVYTRELARNHKLDPRLITIDLVEAAPRLLPALPEDFAAAVTRRLRHLGVNIFANRAIVKEEVEAVYLKDMRLRTKTVIWTAGVKAHSLYAHNAGLLLDPKGRVVVDDYLQARGQPEVFVIGDAAATPHAGMAQTAIRDAAHVAGFIVRKLTRRSVERYAPKKPFYVIPVGPKWAAAFINGVKIYGRAGWWLRRLADLRFFLSILPRRKALLAFQSEKTLCESCLICTPEGGEAY